MGYWSEHFSKLVLNCCVTGPELLRASLIYTSVEQFRTMFTTVRVRFGSFKHPGSSKNVLKLRDNF